MTLNGNRQQATFGVFRFDLSSNELSKSGIRLRLEDKPSLVLRRLIEKSGQIVTRKELQELLWPDGVFVDFEHGLNKAINRLRAVLGDDRDEPRFIETISRRGYRFVANVKISPQPPNVEFVPAQIIAEQPPSNAEATNIFLVAIPEIQQENQTGRPFILASERKHTWRRFLPIVAAGMVGLTITAVRIPSIRSLRTTRNVISLPSQIRLTTTSENLGLAISPDGSRVVFSASGSDNQPSLWLRRLPYGQPEAIPGTDGASFPFWSPDGNELGFFVGSELKRMNLRDHSTRTLCPVDSGRGGTWSRSGIILFASGTRSPIFKISAEGGTPVPVTTLDEPHFTTHRWPCFFPDGRHFVFLAASHDRSWAPGAIFLGSLDGGKQRLLAESDSNPVTFLGSVMFLSHGKLISQPLDLEKGLVDARANIIADAVDYDLGLWYGGFSASTSKILYRPRQIVPNSNTLVWFDRNGNKLGNVGPRGTYREISLSPDGNTIATRCGDPESNICLVHPDNTVTQITQTGTNGWPVWSDDSHFFSYYTHAGNTSHSVIVKSLDGAAPSQTILTSSKSMVVTSWHPDNRHALLLTDLDNGVREYSIFDLVTKTTTPYLSPSTGPFESLRFSPDGHWVAYSTSSAGRDELYVVSYPNPSVRYLVASKGRGPKWRGDGRELYFVGLGNALNFVSITAERGALKFGNQHRMFDIPIPPDPWDVGAFDVTRDGARVLVVTAPTTEPSQLILVSNLF